MLELYGSGSLYNDEASNRLQKITSESIDLVYTDPPYELNYQTNIPGDKRWNKTQQTNNRFEILENDTKGMINWKEIWEQLFRILKNDSFFFLHCNMPFIMNYGNDIITAGFKYKGCVAWNKNFAIGGGLKTTMKRDWEPICYYSKGDAGFNSIEVIRNNKIVTRKRISEIQDWNFSLKTQEKSGHPTQKPIQLAKQIINRNAILIEKSEKFCSIIEKRLLIRRT